MQAMVLSCLVDKNTQVDMGHYPAGCWLPPSNMFLLHTAAGCSALQPVMYLLSLQSNSMSQQHKASVENILKMSHWL